MKCKKCGVEFTPKKGLKNYCSLECRNSRTWSDEDKKKKSVASLNSEKVKEMAERFRKPIFIKNCIVCGKEFKTKDNSRELHSKFCTLEYHEKQSNIIKEHYKNGRGVHGGTTKWYFIETSNGVIKVQGTYEVRVCRILDRWKKEKAINNWEYTNDRIQYTGLDGKIHNYLIDFKIFRNDGTFYYLETKGYEKEVDKLKWNAVREQGFEIEIWFNEQIKENEI